MSEDEITQVENFVNSKIEARLKLEEKTDQYLLKTLYQKEL